ncbi:MAG: porphobilinogen synthase [Cyanobacteria bacterium P01_H01_bin.74]
MNFPVNRKRRLRKTKALRNLIAETRVHPAQLVLPIFVHDNYNDQITIDAMPGVYQYSIEKTLAVADKALKAGIQSVLLFGVPSEKDQRGSTAWFEGGVVQQATRKLKTRFGTDLTVITDTCLCEYTSHGHCGVYLDGQVLNDPTLELLAKVAVSQAQSGADIIAPSDMMDGRIGYIRDVLDDEGYDDKAIMAYSAKYASGYYGPFRDAAKSTPIAGDRKTYQMDARNGREALAEIKLDIYEGADIIMVKPAMAYLDIVYQAKQACDLPIAAYQVSGQYSMIKAAAEKGWVDEKAVVLEDLTAMARAGADILITYFAQDAAGWLNE